MGRQNQELTSESSDARNSLINAAVKLFAAHGYNATGVQQITDMAGVNKATLYYYFLSKEGIYNVLIEEGLRLLDRAVTAAEDTGSSIMDRLRLFLGAYLTVAFENQDLAKIVFREAFGECESARVMVAENFKSRVRRVSAVIRQAQDNGEIRSEIDADFAAYMLFGIANMFITRLVVDQRQFDVEPLVEQVFEIFIRGAGTLQARKPE